MSTNKVFIVGRLSKDPDVRYTQSGKVVTNFTVAVPRQHNKEKADFIKIVVWGKRAEACGNNLIKGQLVSIDGSWQNNDYTDKEGNKRFSSEVLAREVSFLTKPRTESSTNKDKVAVGTKNFKPVKKSVDKPPFSKK